MLRIPNLADPKNEVVQYAGIAIAVLTWAVTWLTNSDFATSEGIIAALSVLASNMASGRVWSQKSAVELGADV